MAPASSFFLNSPNLLTMFLRGTSNDKDVSTWAVGVTVVMLPVTYEAVPPRLSKNLAHQTSFPKSAP